MQFFIVYFLVWCDFDYLVCFFGCVVECQCWVLCEWYVFEVILQCFVDDDCWCQGFGVGVQELVFVEEVFVVDL